MKFPHLFQKKNQTKTKNKIKEQKKKTKTKVTTTHFWFAEQRTTNIQSFHSGLQLRYLITEITNF